MAALLAGQEPHGGEGGKEPAAQAQNVAALRAVKAHDGAELQLVQAKGGGEVPHAGKQDGHVPHAPLHGGVQSHAHRHEPADDGGPDQETHRSGPQLLLENGHFTAPLS